MSTSSPGNGNFRPPDIANTNAFSSLSNASEFPLPSKISKQQRKRQATTQHLCSAQDHRNQQQTQPIGPRFLTLSRNEENSSVTMEMVSPFLIQKIIEINAGKNVEIKKLRNGTYLLKTNTFAQATNLCKIKKFSDTINVKIEEHSRLNTSKGVVFCPGLQYVSDQEIIENMQGVVEIKRMMKKVNNELVPNNNFILTFDTPNLPTELMAAFMKLEVRPFIPQPLRCFKMPKVWTFNCSLQERD